MEIVIRAAACAVIGSVLALLLKKYTPEFSLSVTILTGAAVLWLASSVCARIVDVLRETADRGGVSSIYFVPVLKCVAIGVVAHLASQICRDAGQGSAASAVELCAALCALYVSLPLLESLLTVVERLF